jgi:hypothetical protein
MLRMPYVPTPTATEAARPTAVAMTARIFTPSEVRKQTPADARLRRCCDFAVDVLDDVRANGRRAPAGPVPIPRPAAQYLQG